MEFPTKDEFAKEVAEKALDEFIYEGKTIREWVEILVKQQPCEDAISRAEALRIAKSYYHAEYVVDKIRQLPSVTPKPSEDCRNCKKWNECLCGKEGHENGTSIGYSIGECKEYEPCEDAISRQDAVDIINGYAEQFNGYIGTPNDTEVYAYARGLLLSIERNISALPPVTPKAELCEDCISRQAAIDAIAKLHPVDTEYDCTLYDKLDVMYVLKDLPSVTPTVSKMKQDEDYISREAVKQLICQNNDKYGYSDTLHALERRTKAVSDHEALKIAIKALEQISHFAPCKVCEFYTGDGCNKQGCMFEGVRADE